MKNWSRLMIAGVVLAASGAANAQVSSTVTATSDYDYRGITQTGLDPALQVSLDYAFGESGFAIGAWGSNVDFGPGTDSDLELDLYLSYTKELENGFNWNVGYVQYTYPSSDDKIEYGEYSFGLGFNNFSAKLWWSDDFLNSGDSALYTEVNYSQPLPAEFALNFHVGRSSGPYWGPEDYTDWSVGVSKTWSHFDFALRYVDGSDLKSANDLPGDYNTSDSKVIFSVSTSFPWGE